MTSNPDARRTLEVPGIGRLIVGVTNGARVEAAPGADPAEVDGLLRGSGQAWLLQVRSVLPLHLAAVAIAGARAMSPGSWARPAQGSLGCRCALSERGWQLVTDDIAALRWDPTGRPPAARPQSPAVTRLGRQCPPARLGHQPAAPARRRRRQVRLRPARALPGDPVRLAAIYPLNLPGAAARDRLQPDYGEETLRRLPPRRHLQCRPRSGHPRRAAPGTSPKHCACPTRCLPGT